MMAAINAAIQVFETNYADDFTLNITYLVDTNVNLAQSDNSFAFVNYSDYRAALESKATSVNDALALSQLPNTSTDPVIGGAQMLITVPLASMLGLTTLSPDGVSIHFNTNVLNLTRPDPNNDNFDLQSAIEHEMDEVLGGGGAGCTLNDFSQIGALDLFRYATNSADATLARTWTLDNGDNAYFSVDGTNLWARFNNLLGADLGDFWGVDYDPVSFLPLYWSPPGVTPHAQVQNAYATESYFSYPTNFAFYPTTNYYYENTSPDLATNEFTMLDVIGWTLTANLTQPAGPVISIAKTGANQITLSWAASAAGYSLQERANLASGSWVASATGAENPAVITIANAQKFYRLADPTVKPAIARVRVDSAKPLGESPAIKVVRGWMPSDKMKRQN
jgi:hypothetical protein